MYRRPRFRHGVFPSLSKSRSRLRAKITRRGWQADVTTSRVCKTGTPGPAGASFERNFFDFVETSQDPDVDRTTSTVTALIRTLLSSHTSPSLLSIFHEESSFKMLSAEIHIVFSRSALVVWVSFIQPDSYASGSLPLSNGKAPLRVYIFPNL